MNLLSYLTKMKKECIKLDGVNYCGADPVLCEGCNGEATEECSGCKCDVCENSEVCYLFRKLPESWEIPDKEPSSESFKECAIKLMEHCKIQ